MASTRELFDRITDAFNAHDRAAAEALCADDCEFTASGGMRGSGRAESIAMNWAWIEAFPDARVEVRKVYVDGDVAIEESVFTGTHDGVLRTPMGDIPPTGKRLEGDFIGINVFRDGKVVRQSILFDRMQLMEQLGLVPEPAAAGS